MFTRVGDSRGEVTEPQEETLGFGDQGMPTDCPTLGRTNRNHRQGNWHRAGVGRDGPRSPPPGWPGGDGVVMAAKLWLSTCPPHSIPWPPRGRYWKQRPLPRAALTSGTGALMTWGGGACWRGTGAGADSRLGGLLLGKRVCCGPAGLSSQQDQFPHLRNGC